MSDADQPTEPQEESAATAQGNQQQTPRVQVDDSGASCSYANFCRVVFSAAA